METIFSYTDYRCFLKDWFFGQKQANDRFSYRYFNRLAGLKSSGFVKLLIDGKRNLEQDGLKRVMKGLKLTGPEQSYFEDLVYFTQAKTHEAKKDYFQRMCRHRKFIQAKPLMVAQYNLYSSWFNVAILELVRLDGKETKDVHWLQRQIRPEVPLRELTKSVRDLLQLGLLKETASGNLIRQEAMLTTPDEVKNMVVANFHIEMSNLARHALQTQTSEEREFSALTIATSRQAYARIKQEMRDFRKRLHSILEQMEPESKQVVGHLNLQLFKLNQ